MTSTYSHLVPVLKVKNLTSSIEFYQRALNWSLSFTWGNPIVYAVVNDGGQIQLHLNHVDREIDPSPIVLRIFVPGVRELYKRMLNDDIVIDEPILREDYGMIDFSIKDPDGYRLVFGTGEELLKP